MRDSASVYLTRMQRQLKIFLCTPTWSSVLDASFKLIFRLKEHLPSCKNPSQAFNRVLPSQVGYLKLSWIPCQSETLALLYPGKPLFLHQDPENFIYPLTSTWLLVSPSGPTAVCKTLGKGLGSEFRTALEHLSHVTQAGNAAQKWCGTLEELIEDV